MLQEILVAVALVLVLEGLYPFLSPGGYRRMLGQMGKLGDRTLRIIGLSSMLIGLLLLTLIR